MTNERGINIRQVTFPPLSSVFSSIFTSKMKWAKKSVVYMFVESKSSEDQMNIFNNPQEMSKTRPQNRTQSMWYVFIPVNPTAIFAIPSPHSLADIAFNSSEENFISPSRTQSQSKLSSLRNQTIYIFLIILCCFFTSSWHIFYLTSRHHLFRVSEQTNP